MRLPRIQNVRVIRIRKAKQTNGVDMPDLRRDYPDASRVVWAAQK